jgi:two-component sensor histidine kinase
LARDLTGRLAALGRAHDLVGSAHSADQKAALLGDLLSVLLAPYDDMGDFQGRIRVSVPRISVGQKSGTTLALVVHELATNSLKYGALSVPTGTLDLSCTAPSDEVVLLWTEQGGPLVEAPAAGGFGSKLVTRSMSGLGGSINCDWSPAGVVITLRMNVDRLGK